MSWYRQIQCLRSELTIQDQNTFWNRVLLPLTGEALAHGSPDLTWLPVRASGTSLALARGQIRA